MLTQYENSKTCSVVTMVNNRQHGHLSSKISPWWPSWISRHPLTYAKFQKNPSKSATCRVRTIADAAAEWLLNNSTLPRVHLSKSSLLYQKECHHSSNKT
jgi:hypothetical protein